MMKCFIACRRKSDLQSIIQRGEQEMLKTPIARGVALATLGATLAIPSMAQAAFIEDTKAGLELRNFYMNSDSRQDGAAQSKRSEEHTSELQSLMRISYAVFCLKKKTKEKTTNI